MALKRSSSPSMASPLLRTRGFGADGEGWRARYLVDRAHNIVLDHLVTGGLIGVGLWALLIGALFASGVARAYAATTHGERAVRIGALGAIVAHLVEEQVGIVTPMPLALFWVAASLCTLPSWSERPNDQRPRRAERRGSRRSSRRRFSPGRRLV